MNLLLALVKHYGTLENQDKSKVPPFGWTNAKAHFAVELNDDGSIDDILALGGHDKKNRGVVFEVPVRRARTSTPVPYLFCDTAQYILGNVSSTSKPGTYLSMKNAVLAFRGDLGESPALNAAYKFFETWDPEKALQNKFVASAMAFKDAETSTFILFYEGSPIFDDETFRTAYEEIVEKYGEFPIQADRNGNVSITAAPAHMRSMITGEDGLKANGTISKKCVKHDTAQNGSVSKRAKEIGVIKRHLPGCEKDVLCIGIKNKEAKFSNRTRPEGWLTPTANQLLQTHINLVKKIRKFLPISDAVLEINKFAFMQLDNPNIQKWQYQQGPLYQKANLEEAVSEMQEHHCLFCKKPIAHYHHVVSQSENGSDTIGNIVGLCTKHHDLVHKDTAWQKKLAKKKTGLNKKYGALSVLNQIIPALTKELSSLFPKHFFATHGKSTYDYRSAHGVSKDHWLDAYCIACSVLPNDVCDSGINNRVPYELKQFRRHDRRALNNENMSRVYMLNDNVVATNRHKATKQTTDSLEEFRQNHPDDVCKLKVKEHHPTYRNMNRNYPGSVFLIGKQVHVMQGIAGSKDGEATTYKDTNANSIAAGKCKFVAKNSGILFV